MRTLITKVRSLYLFFVLKGKDCQYTNPGNFTKKDIDGFLLTLQFKTTKAGEIRIWYFMICRTTYLVLVVFHENYIRRLFNFNYDRDGKLCIKVW